MTLDFTCLYKFGMENYTIDEAASDIAFNTRRLHKYLGDEGLKLAPDKSKILTSNKELAKKIEEANVRQQVSQQSSRRIN